MEINAESGINLWRLNSWMNEFSIFLLTCLKCSKSKIIKKIKNGCADGWIDGIG